MPNSLFLRRRIDATLHHRQFAGTKEREGIAVVIPVAVVIVVAVIVIVITPPRDDDASDPCDARGRARESEVEQGLPGAVLAQCHVAAASPPPPGRGSDVGHHAQVERLEPKRRATTIIGRVRSSRSRVVVPPVVLPPRPASSRPSSHVVVVVVARRLRR